MLSVRQQQLLASKSNSSSTCSTVHLGSRHICLASIRPHTFLRRSGTVFGVPSAAAGRAGSPAGRISTAAHRGGNHKPTRRQGSHPSHVDAPEHQGSALEITMIRSIKQISPDNVTAPQELADVVNEWSSSFSSVTTAAVLVKAAKLRHLQPAAAKSLLDKLAGIWDTQLPVAGRWELANVMWACGKLRYPDPQLWSSTFDAYLEETQHVQLQQVPSRHISSVLHGLANAAVANKGEVPGVPRTRVEAAVKQLVEHMCILVTHPLLEGVQPQNISNTLWACAKLRITPGDAALDKLLQTMSRPAMLEEAISQNLANTLWATTELRQRCGWQPGVGQRVWERLLDEQQLRTIADKGVPGEISNTLLALLRLSSAVIGAEAAGVVISRELAQICAAQLLQGRAAQQLDAWSEQAVANSMSACAKLGVCDVKFLGKASASSPKWLPGAVAAGVEQVAYACRVLQFREQRLMTGVVKRSKQLLQQSGRRQLHDSLRITLAAQVGCAAAALDMQQLAGDVKELVASTGVKQASKATPGQLGMLWEVHAWLLQHQLLDGRGLAELLSQQQLTEGRVAAAEYCAAHQHAKV